MATDDLIVLAALDLVEFDGLAPFTQERLLARMKDEDCYHLYVRKLAGWECSASEARLQARWKTINVANAFTISELILALPQSRALTVTRFLASADITKGRDGFLVSGSDSKIWPGNFPRYIRRARGFTPESAASRPLAPAKKDIQLSDAEWSILREITQKRKEAVEEILGKLAEVTA